MSAHPPLSRQKYDKTKSHSSHKPKSRKPHSEEPHVFVYSMGNTVSERNGVEIHDNGKVEVGHENE